MKFDFEVIEIDKNLTTKFVQKYHYSPVMPAITKHYLGFFLDGDLKGALTLGWGTKPRHTFNKMFPNVGILEKEDGKFVHDIKDWYYEIGKMCQSTELNHNRGAGSQMVSATIKWLKNNTKCQFLYTMADGIMGKCGFVYQASNFYYGEKYFTSVYLMENGEKLHPRTSKDLCRENAQFLVDRYGEDYLKNYKEDPKTGETKIGRGSDKTGAKGRHIDKINELIEAVSNMITKSENKSWQETLKAKESLADYITEILEEMGIDPKALKR